MVTAAVSRFKRRIAVQIGRLARGSIVFNGNWGPLVVGKLQ